MIENINHDLDIFLPYHEIANNIYITNQHIQSADSDILEERFILLKKEAVENVFCLYRLIFAGLKCSKTEYFYPANTPNTAEELSNACCTLEKILTDICDCQDLDKLRVNISNVISKVMCFFFSNRLNDLTIYYITRNKICEDCLKENYSIILPRIKANSNIITAFENITSNFPTLNTMNPAYINTNLLLENKTKTSMKLYGLRNIEHSPLFSANYKALYEKLCPIYDYTSIRMSQDFDLGFLNLISISRDRFDFPDSNKIKTDFYFTNKHVMKNGIMIINTVTCYTSFEDILFFTSYLEDSDAVCSIESTSIIGKTTKKFEEKPEDVFKIIKKIISQKLSVKEYHLNVRQNNNLIFRSTELTEDVLDELFENNSEQVKEINNRFWKILSNDYDKKKRNPLLPFNPGQLGLVLVSGDIDGIVDEGNGYYHVIKGSVYREAVTTEEEPDKEGERKYSTTNAVRTSVSVFLPNGDFIELK